MPRPPSSGLWRDLYGPRRNPVTKKEETHHGLDIGDEAGTLLVAPADCVLVGYGPVPGWGAHGRVARLLDVFGFEHWLSHTDRVVPGVVPGSTLREGAPVAHQGETGMTTGRHVHWETRIGAQRVDPVAWLARTASTNAKPFDPTKQGVTDMGFMFLFHGIAVPNQFYIGTYEGLTFSCRPTYNPEQRAILALPLPRVQITDAELVELCRQGGYVAA